MIIYDRFSHSTNYKFLLLVNEGSFRWLMLEAMGFLWVGLPKSSHLICQ